MTKEEQFEAAHILKERISLEIHELVEEALSGTSTEMSELILDLLNDEFRHTNNNRKSIG